MGQAFGFRSNLEGFTMVPYAYVLALAVIIAAHSALCMGYYMLPLDDQGRKCIKGKCASIELCACCGIIRVM